jgi:hypothetical protein
MQAKDTVVQEVHAIQNETEIEDDDVVAPSKHGPAKETSVDSSSKQQSFESTRQRRAESARSD